MDEISDLRVRIGQLVKVEEENRSLKADRLGAFNQGKLFRRTERAIRKEYLSKFKELKEEYLQELRKKNRVIESMR